VRWAWLGQVPYAEALVVQERIREAVLQGVGSETLLMLEHQPVITLGRNANAANVLASPEALQASGVAVVRVSRGGDVTFHGPGQLVGYPVFRVRSGLRSHMSAMGKAIVAVLGELGIAADWRESHPGVWVGDEKICAVGVHVRRGVAIHGFALNVTVDLNHFANIIPCGMRAFGVTSIAKLGTAPPMDVLVESVARVFAQFFDVSMERISVA
jgi:lipoyl(octanoyl) transferase